jgi:hypothetical protein
LKYDVFSLYVVFNYSKKDYSIDERRGNCLDQKKIGALLKELRNEKGLTQEQFAESSSPATTARG